VFVADLPPELPPAYIQTVCSEKTARKPFDSFEGMTYDELINRATLTAKAKDAADKSMKFEMIKQSGFSYGTQGGFYARTSEIKKMLKSYEDYLDKAFDFSALMLNTGKVVPPVISESTSSIAMTDSRSLRVTDVTYVIDKPARFSAVPPNWRNYLFIMTPKKPDVPDKTLLPVSDAEQKAWEKAVKLGWAAGYCQADKAYASALADLRHDFIGMVRYHILLRKNIVSIPFVTATDEKITREDNKLVIGDQILRITAMPGFKIDNSQWDGLVERKPFFERPPVNPHRIQMPVIKPAKVSTGNPEVLLSKPLPQSTKRVTKEKAIDRNPSFSAKVEKRGEIPVFDSKEDIPVKRVKKQEHKNMKIVGQKDIVVVY